MVERRRHPRYDCSFPVRYATEGDVGIEGEGASKNISRGGMCLVMSAFVRKGDRLKLAINPKDEDEAVWARGKVVWTRRITGIPIPRIDAGIEFNEADPDDIQRLLPT